MPRRQRRAREAEEERKDVQDLRDALDAAEEAKEEIKEEVKDDEPVVIGRRGARAAELRKFAMRDAAVKPTDGIEWKDARHVADVRRVISRDDPRIDDPAGFKGHLHAPQASLLHAILRLEACPVLRVAYGMPPVTAGLAEPALVIAHAAEQTDRHQPLLQTDTLLIAEDFGFGKTVTIIALVAASKCPRHLPAALNLPLMSETKNRAMVTVGPTAHGRSCHFNPEGDGFLPEITCLYDRVLPLTLVAAAASVISQWENDTKRFTNLKYFVIENVHTLREFEQVFRSGRINMYDMIFVKVGKVTTSFKVAGEKLKPGKSVDIDDGPIPKTPAGPKSRALLQAIGAVMDGYMLARMVVDDYDTIRLSSEDNLLPALSKILITATRRTTMVRVEHHASDPAAPLHDFLGAALNTFPVLGAALDDVLYGCQSLHCDPDYVREHINTTTITAHRIFVQGGRAAAVLRDLGVGEDIVEMINADAIGAAADALGINVKNTRDLIDRILKDRRGKYAQAIGVLARVARARNEIALQPGEETDAGKIKYMRATLKDGADDEVDAMLESIDGPSAAVTSSLNSLELWAREQRDKFGRALQNMRDNIREQKCQCCMIPLTPEDGEPGEDAYILNCCQIIVCEPCIAVGAMAAGEKRRFINKCPSCARPVSASKDFIRVGKELSLEDALSDDILQDAPAARPPKRAPAPDDPAEEKGVAEDGEPAEENGADETEPAGNDIDALVDGDEKGDGGDEKEEKEAKDPLDRLGSPKLKALIQIIRQVPADEVSCIRRAVVPLDSKGLLEGKRDVPWPAGKPKKFLIAALHAESARVISKALTDCGLPHVELRGTRAQKNAAVEDFKGPVHIMLTRDYSGLHLPFVAVGIEYHHIVNPGIRAQFRGRFHRTGRDYSSECYTLVNEAEADAMR